MTGVVDPWSEGWPERIRDTVRALGFRNVADMLSSMPACSYSEVSKHFAFDVAPIQLISVQFLEAKQDGTLRQAVMDSLSRNIVEQLPKGWGCGDKSDWRAILALSSWSSEVQGTGDCEELKPLLHEISNYLLKTCSPPKGWIPTGPDDPVITEAFDKYWPE